MRIVVVMDPPEAVHVEGDTSFALMAEAARRGHLVEHCLAKDLVLDQGRVFARVRRASMREEARPPIALGLAEEVSLHDVDLVLVRTDPPFDTPYLWCTQMLERVVGDTLVVNHPRGLREANEKLYACHFPDLMPRTIVTSEAERIRGFVREVGGRAVVKPLDGRGGEGVMALGEGDPNFNAIVEQQTHFGTRVAMLQEYLPAIREGDKRILVLEGRPLGALLRMPQGGDLRSNLHIGGVAVKATIDAADQRIVERLAPRLLADGLWFVGLDVIGGKLTEVNVTSPTGIRQMSRLDQIDYPAQVLDWLEAKAAKG
jgi:glutathione synthase